MERGAISETVRGLQWLADRAAAVEAGDKAKPADVPREFAAALFTVSLRLHRQKFMEALKHAHDNKLGNEIFGQSRGKGISR